MQQCNIATMQHVFNATLSAAFFTTLNIILPIGNAGFLFCDLQFFSLSRIWTEFKHLRTQLPVDLHDQVDNGKTGRKNPYLVYSMQ